MEVARRILPAGDKNVRVNAEECEERDVVVLNATADANNNERR